MGEGDEYSYEENEGKNIYFEAIPK